MGEEKKKLEKEERETGKENGRKRWRGRKKERAT